MICFFSLGSTHQRQPSGGGGGGQEESDPMESVKQSVAKNVGSYVSLIVYYAFSVSNV